MLSVASGVRWGILKRGRRMRLFKLFGFIVIFLFALRLASAWGADNRDELAPAPVMRTVDPDSVKAGDLVTVTGENLDRSRVSELYMTNGTTDLKVRITEQTATTIKFNVPQKVAPGRYNLMILLVSDPPKLLEEPARLTVVE